MMIVNPPVMTDPNDDGLYILDTDACADSIGSVLSQKSKRMELNV